MLLSCSALRTDEVQRGDWLKTVSNYAHNDKLSLHNNKVNCYF